jgi:hypothetical protein
MASCRPKFPAPKAFGWMINLVADFDSRHKTECTIQQTSLRTDFRRHP